MFFLLILKHLIVQLTSSRVGILNLNTTFRFSKKKKPRLRLMKVYIILFHSWKCEPVHFDRISMLTRPLHFYLTLRSAGDVKHDCLWRHNDPTIVECQAIISPNDNFSSITPDGKISEIIIETILFSLTNCTLITVVNFVAITTFNKAWTIYLCWGYFLHTYW